MIGHASSKDSRAERPTCGPSAIGTNLMIKGKFASAKGASLQGVWGQFWNMKALKRHFLHSQADSYVKKVPKIDRYFLLIFDKNRVVISFNIFLKYLIIIVTPLFNSHKILTIPVAYEGPKVHSVVLSSVQLRSAASLLQSALWEKDWSLVSHNVKV